MIKYLQDNDISNGRPIVKYGTASLNPAPSQAAPMSNHDIQQLWLQRHVSKAEDTVMKELSVDDEAAIALMVQFLNDDYLNAMMQRDQGLIRFSQGHGLIGTPEAMRHLQYLRGERLVNTL